MLVAPKACLDLGTQECTKKNTAMQAGQIPTTVPIQSRLNIKQYCGLQGLGVLGSKYVVSSHRNRALAHFCDCRNQFINFCCRECCSRDSTVQCAAIQCRTVAHVRSYCAHTC